MAKIPISGSYVVVDGVVTFTPTSDFPSGVTIEVTINTSLRGVANQRLATSYAFNFDTVGSPAAGWSMIAGFENGTIGQLANNAHSTPQEDAFSDPDTGSATTFDNVANSGQVNSGSKSCKMAWTLGDTGYDACTGLLNFPEHVVEGQSIWVRGYYYFPAGWSWVPRLSNPYAPVKILRIHVADSVGGNIGYVSIMEECETSSPFGGKIRYSNEPEVANTEVTTSTIIPKGEQVCLELYVKLHHTAGESRIWMNGDLVYENLIAPTLRNANDYADRVNVMSYWNDGCPADQNMWLDDFKVTTVEPTTEDADGNKMIGPLS
jgi:hypothetical protein